MKKLLDATEIATTFLDYGLVVKRFTPLVHRIVSLLPADVGRPIMHLASSLRYEHFVLIEASIQTTQGEWCAMLVLPYRTLDNYLSGAVIIPTLPSTQPDAHRLGYAYLHRPAHPFCNVHRYL